MEGWLKPLGFRNTKVAADFAGEMIVDLAVSRNCAASFGDGVAPPRVASAFAQEFAAQSRQMSQQITTFHTAMRSSS